MLRDRSSDGLVEAPRFSSWAMSSVGYGTVGSKPRRFPTLSLVLRTRFPGLDFKFDQKYLYHPRGLKAILKHRLRFSPPNVAVISVPAMYAARSWRGKHGLRNGSGSRGHARAFLQKIEQQSPAAIPGHPGRPPSCDGRARSTGPFRLMRYERLLQEALEYCRQTSACRLV